MKNSLLMFIIGLALVDSMPNVSDRNGTTVLPCGGNISNVVNCTCTPDGDVVTPDGPSCQELGQTLDFDSCYCLDDRKWL